MNNLFLLMCSVWLNVNIIEHTYTCFIALGITRLGYKWSLDFADPLSLPMWHYNVLVTIWHFFKWLKLVPLLDYGSKWITYDFLNMVFIKFCIPRKIFIDHMKFHGEFQKH